MCHHMILGDYICEECLSALRNQKNTWPANLTQEELEARIEAFLDTHKKSDERHEGRQALDLAFERTIR